MTLPGHNSILVKMVSSGGRMGTGLDQELEAFRHKFGFKETDAAQPRTVPVYTGCMLVPLPNIESRRRFLKYHDLHHLVTGYSVGRIGEGEISAWELGTGSAWQYPVLGVMNLIALSTGLFLYPKRMWHAFKRGCHSQNLYSRKTREAIDAADYDSINALQTLALPKQRVYRESGFTVGLLRYPEFVVYCLFALAIHLSLVLPAIVLRVVSDTLYSGGFIKAVQPSKRTDIF